MLNTDETRRTKCNDIPKVFSVYAQFQGTLSGLENIILQPLSLMQIFHKRGNPILQAMGAYWETVQQNPYITFSPLYPDFPCVYKTVLLSQEETGNNQNTATQAAEQHLFRVNLKTLSSPLLLLDLEVHWAHSHPEGKRDFSFTRQGILFVLCCFIKKTTTAADG